MTYNPNIPLASASPFLFPPQALGNFTRLQQIIQADHVFNLTQQTSDGFHNQVSLISQTPPTVVPTSASGVFYCFQDTNNQAQLGWRNSVANFQLTPNNIYPLRIYGTATVAGKSGSNPGTFTAYPDPGFQYTGLLWVLVQNTGVYQSYTIVNVGGNGSGNDLTKINSQSGTPSTPSAIIASTANNNLIVQNQDSTSQIIQWSLIINRLA